MTTERRSAIRAICIAAVVLIAAVLTLDLPTLEFSHLRLDDAGYTVACPFVKDGLSLSNLATALTDLAHGAIWMPLTYATYMTDISIWGTEWAAFHLTNVLLHAVNAVLLFLLILHLLRKRDLRCPFSRLVVAAGVGALLWALHPMRAEAVAWIAGRKEELWTCFALAGLLVWLRYLNCPCRRTYLATFLLFILACLSKPTALAFPFLAFVVDRCGSSSRPIRFRAYVPMLIVSVAVGAIAVYSESHPTGFAAVDIYETSLAWRLLNAAVALGLYLAHTFWPVGVHFDYRAVFGGIPRQCALGLSVLGGAAVLTLLAALKSRRREIALVLGWFLIPIIPALGVFGIVGDQAAADRYTYLASGGFAFLVAWGLSRLQGRRRVLAMGGVALALAGEAVLAVRVTQSFRNDLATFSRVLAFDPEHPRALHYVGAEYCARENRYAEGLAMIRRSEKLAPRLTTASTLAYLLAYRGQAGDFAEVKSLGASVLAQPKRDVEGLMLDALGVVAFREGDDRKAVRLLSLALAAPHRSHTRVHAMLKLGLALANIGCDREALRILTPLRRQTDKTVRERATSACLTLAQGHHHPRFAW